MNSSIKYKMELNPYFLTDSAEKSDLSADFFYGKFFNYLSDKDYVGASLVKDFFLRGKQLCSRKGYKNSRFSKYHNQIKRDIEFNKLEKNFFYDGLDGK